MARPVQGNWFDDRGGGGWCAALTVRARSCFVSLVAPATHGWLRQVLAAAELVPIVERVAPCRDPTDDRFLELAVNGRADFIVTGDPDLLVFNRFRGIPILTPAAF